LGYAVEPALVSDGSRGAIISWQHYHGDGFDFFAQRIDSCGDVMWQSGGVDLGNQNDPSGKMENNLSLVNNSPGNVLLIMWQYPSGSDSSPQFTVVSVPIVERLDLPMAYTIYIKNARDWAIGLILTGFVLASVVCVALRLREKLEENARLRWLAVLFLLAADVSFVFSMLAHQYLTLDVAVVTGILVILSVIVWKAPFTGGIAAVTAAPLLLLSLAFMNGNPPFGRIDWLYHSLVITSLVVGGALSIVWGRRRRQGLNVHSQFAIASVVVGSLSLLVVGAWVFAGIMLSLEGFVAYLSGSGEVSSSGYAWVLNPHVLIFLSAFSVSSIAFVCGIIGLKSNLKGISISGIVLCSLALIPLVLFGLSEYAWLLSI
jgi:hypothetical protein